jgi:hypothetical protein
MTGSPNNAFSVDGENGREGILSAAFGFLLAFFLLLPQISWAHGVAGQRFFPTTFVVDDPFISDEFSLLYNGLTMNDPAGGPRIQTWSLDAAFSKRITAGFGIEVDEQYQSLHTEGDGTVSGFANTEVNVKYQFFTSDEHETILSVGVSDEIGHTGSSKVGADPFSTISPAFYFGKGFGDLPESLGALRPLAVTGVIGPNIPLQKTTSTANDQGGVDVERNPTTLTWSFTLQYSFLYLQSFVKDVGLITPFNRMVAIVEFSNETCLNEDCKNQTTSTINPGIAWIGKFTQFGVAAQIPTNSRSGADIGVLGLFHVFIDDLFPKSIGRPIFP